MNEMMDAMATTPRRKRRRHSLELKENIMVECAEPSASVSGIAMAHGINANIVHSWRKRARKGEFATQASAAGFVPVTLAPCIQQEVKAPAHVAIEVHRAGLLLKLSWPLSAAEQLSAWTRKLLR